ncbi:hypothetical protein D917_10754, partial [Trichinella nativa]
MFQKEEQNVKLVMSKLDFHFCIQLCKVPYFTECFTLSYQFAVVALQKTIIFILWHHEPASLSTIANNRIYKIPFPF